MLPAVSAKSKSDTASSSPVESSEGSETVLIVEDEAAVRAIASYSLQKIGYRVLTASDADEALRIAESVGGQVNLLATDVVLPDRSGRDLAVELLARFPRLRVLFLSGYTDDEVLKYGIEQSAVAFLQKPYTPEMLAQKIRGILDSQGPAE